MMNINPNYDEIGEFLSEISEDRSKDFIQLCTLPDGRKKDGVYCKIHQKVTQLDDFSRNILKPIMDPTFAEGKGLFINTVSINDNGNRKGTNFIDPLAIVADYDYGTKTLTNDLFIELDLPNPTVRVQSGSGQQFWWFLERESCIKEQRNKICWEIAKITGGNEQLKSHTRLLRLPGSINSKDPQNPKPAYIIQKNYNLRYCLADFEFLLVTNPRLNPIKKSNRSSK
jgi:RepB DNA-primase from phage plasmid